MKFYSPTTFAFESVAKRHGENTCFSYKDLKSTASEVGSLYLIHLLVCMDPLHFQYLKIMRLS